MNIILTGVTGFIGSRIALYLVGAGNTVIGIKRRSSSLNRLEKHKNLHLCDVEDGIESILNGIARPVDVVIHCATEYGRSAETFADLYSANVIYPLTLMNAAVKKNLAIFVNLDTFFCKTENNYKYLSNYIQSKQQFKEIGVRYSEAGNLKFLNIGLEHVYGPGDGEGKFITTLITDLVLNKPVIPLTEGAQLRDFVFIDDVCSAIETIVRKSIESKVVGFEHYEVGSGEAISIRHLAMLAKEIAGSSSLLDFGAIPYRENEIMFSKAKPTALQAFGWKNTHCLDDGLKSTIEHIKKINYSKANAG